MPFKPNKSPKDVARNVGKVLLKLSTVKVQAALYDLAYEIGANADQYVPIDTSNTINSRETNVIPTPRGYRAVIGYYTAAASYLHGDENYTPVWQPRPVPSAGKKTGGYNKDAKPQWIPEGVKDTDVMKVIKNASMI